MATGAGETVVDVLEEEWGAIGALGLRLGAEEWASASECPGWTVHDLVAHMVGTERSMLGDPGPPEAPPTPHVHNAVGAANEAWVLARRDVTGPELMAEFEQVTGRRLVQLRAWPAERFDEIGPTPVGMAPYREFLHVRVMDCWVHEQDIRVTTHRPGHRDGRPADIAMGRIASAMPFVVGKRAGAPDGASVRFDLGGPLARRVDVVVVAGRAELTEVVDAVPTVTLQMDGELFWRLGCGRVGGAAALAGGLVVVEGDPALADRVLASMAFMI